MIIFYLLYPILVVIELCLRRCRNVSSCCKKMHRSLSRNLYYSVLLTGMFESYALIATCCLIGLNFLNYDSYGQIV